MATTKLLATLAGAVASLRSAPVGPANGVEVHPRGQGPRGYGSAARRVPALEARDACGVTPRKSRCKRRLGRRTEAGPRRVLPRVRPPCGHVPAVWLR